MTLHAMSVGNPCLDPGLVVGAFVKLRGISSSELLEGVSKVRVITGPRHELMWLLRDLTALTLTAIGRLMGGRDVATVKAGIEGIVARMAADPDYRAQMEKARAFCLAWTAQEAVAAEDAATIIARRLMLDDEPQRADIAALAMAMLSVGAVLRSPDLTDAEARLAALTLIRNAKGVAHA